MLKQTIKKHGNALQKIAENQMILQNSMQEIILAQNKSGVLVMTLLQILIEKGIMTREEVESRVFANEEVALDKEGGCSIPLSTLLDDEGAVAGDDDTGSEEAGS